MKRIMIAVSMAVLVFAAVSRSQAPAQTKTGTLEQELLGLFEEWMNAKTAGQTMAKANAANETATRKTLPLAKPL